MDEVFKFYNVCDDVAKIIAFEVHYGLQCEINDRIDVVVGFDWNYDYWKGTSNNKEVPEEELYLWYDRYYTLDNDKMPIEEYSHMCNKYKVFDILRKTRLYNFLDKTEMRYEDILYEKQYELQDTMSRKCFNNNPKSISNMMRDILKLKIEYEEWKQKSISKIDLLQ